MNKHEVTLGIVIAASYDKAFGIFSKQSAIKQHPLYAEIIDPADLYDLLNRQLGIGLLRAHN